MGNATGQDRFSWKAKLQSFSSQANYAANTTIAPAPAHLQKQNWVFKVLLRQLALPSLLRQFQCNYFRKWQNVPYSVPTQPHSWGMRQHLNSLEMYHTWEISYKVYTLMQTDAFLKLWLLMQLCAYSEVCI